MFTRSAAFTLNPKILGSTFCIFFFRFFLFIASWESSWTGPDKNAPDWFISVCLPMGGPRGTGAPHTLACEKQTTQKPVNTQSGFACPGGTPYVPLNREWFSETPHGWVTRYRSLPHACLRGKNNTKTGKYTKGVCFPRGHSLCAAEQGIVFRVLSLKQGTFLDRKPLTESEGWRWTVYSCGTQQLSPIKIYNPIIIIT